MSVESWDARRTSVAANAASVQLLGPAGDREQLVIYNDSVAADLYVALGSTAASLSSFTAKVAKGASFTLTGDYEGPVQGIWSAADAGFARITEII